MYCVNGESGSSLLIESTDSMMIFLCNIANVAQRTFNIVKKSRSHEHGDISILTRIYVNCTCESRDFHMRDTACRFKKFAANFVRDNGIIEVSLLHI